MRNFLGCVTAGFLLFVGCELPDEEGVTAPEAETAPDDEAPPEVADQRPVPDSATYQGSGDDIIQISPPEDGPMTFHIVGNQAGRHFAVESYAGGQRLDLLVNTTDPYDGVTFDSGQARELDISATGSWTVTVSSIRAAQEVSVPGSTEGTGDFVFRLAGNASVADVTGNAGERHFAVEAYNAIGAGRQLLVNTTDPYQGRTRARSGAAIVIVTAVGPWSIAFS